MPEQETTKIAKGAKHENCPFNEAEIKNYVERKLDERDQRRWDNLKWIIGTTAAFFLTFAAWIYTLGNRVSVLEVKQSSIVEMRQDIKDMKEEIVKLRIELGVKEIE